MGILVKHPVSILSEKAFHRLDYQIMSLAFDLYNSIGNLWDESDYKAKLLDRCIDSGLKALSEVPITVSHKGFSKLYFIDLLIEGAVYELKSYTLKTDNWITDHRSSMVLPDLISELLHEWGAYLDLHLYKEAVLFFTNQPLEDVNKRFCPLNPETLIHFTGLARKKSAYQKNLQKYLDVSPYQQIDWINFDQNRIELHTLRKKSFCH